MKEFLEFFFERDLLCKCDFILKWMWKYYSTFKVEAE